MLMAGPISGKICLDNIICSCSLFLLIIIIHYISMSCVLSYYTESIFTITMSGLNDHYNSGHTENYPLQ